MLIEKATGTIRTAYDLDNEPYLIEITGTEAKRFVNILNADDDGRLLVLPCKIGDLVWSLDFDTSGCQFCLGIGGCFGCINANPIKASCFPFQLRHYNQIGKTIFLSREEAEKAMEETRERKKAMDEGQYEI